MCILSPNTNFGHYANDLATFRFSVNLIREHHQLTARFRGNKYKLLIQLVKSKCLPSLLYATEALPLSKADVNSLEFTFNRILFNIFETSSIDIVHDICFYFNLSSVVNLIIRRKFRFLSKMLNSSNMLCASCKDMVMLDFKLNL